MSCACCHGCRSHIITYSYANESLPGINNDSEPRGQYFDSCPDFGYCLPLPFPITAQPPRSCCGATIDGFIRSNNFSPCCKLPIATVFAGATIDDYGEIAGVKTAETCGRRNMIPNTFTTTPEIVTLDSGAIYLKVPIKVTNSPLLCGPYGLAGVTVQWGFLDHTSCSQHSTPV